MPEQIEAPGGVCVVANIFYRSITYGQDGRGVIVDGAGNTFVGSRWLHGNNSLDYARNIAPNNTIAVKWNVAFHGLPRNDNRGIQDVGKIDAFSMTSSGRDLIVVLGGQMLILQRDNPVELARMPDMFVPLP